MNLSNNYFRTEDGEKLAKPIFETLFLCQIRYKDSLSVDEIKRFGVPTTGDANFDSGMHTQLIDKYFTIDQMVEYYRNNIAFYIRNHNETKDIYDIVSRYLLYWKQILENGINIGGAPIEDLVELDRFACSVYDHAVEHFTDTYIASNLFSYIGNRKMGRAAFDKVVQTQEPENKEVKKRQSLASVFSDKVFSSRGNRG